MCLVQLFQFRRDRMRSALRFARHASSGSFRLRATALSLASPQRHVAAPARRVVNLISRSGDPCNFPANDSTLLGLPLRL